MSHTRPDEALWQFAAENAQAAALLDQPKQDAYWQRIATIANDEHATPVQRRTATMLLVERERLILVQGCRDD